jgi:uncharacterized DUF497 family protein
MVREKFDGFTWDQAKNDRNYRNRGIDFEMAAAVFKDPYCREQDDLREDDGERHYIVTGVVDGVPLIVVWTPRGRNRLILSVRAADAHERLEYGIFRGAF